MAREHDVDLARVPGTGANGRVTKNDLLDWLSKRTPGSATAMPPTPGAEVRPLPFQVYKPPEYRELPGDERVPFTRRRRLIAEHMVYSKHTSPHVFCLAEVDLGRVEAARKASAAAGTPVSFLSYVASAVVRAVRDVPIVNATVLPDAYVVHKVVNLGVAVDTPGGLIVPSIKHADQLSLRGVAANIDELASRARTGKITADDLSSTTFTVSNPGLKGNLFGGAIISQPNVGILRMGEIKKRVVVVTRDGEDTMAIHPVMFIAFSYDHRIIDGVLANSFLWRVADILTRAEFEVS